MGGETVAELRAFAEELAATARELVREALASAPTVEIKPDRSLVTALDKGVEERLRTMISGRYPAHGIVGEEWGSERSGAEHVWILDPIDGTGPYVAGIPVFGTLIGLVRGGRPLVGVADFAATAERWVGAAGEPSTHDGRRLHCRRGLPLAAAMLSTSSPDFYDDAGWRAFRRLRERVSWAVYGGSCYAYARLASGRIDLAVDSAMDVVDILPLVPIIEGAGGLVTDWQGRALDLDWKGSLLAAGDPALHAEALAILATESVP